jgi:hypothetical protein
MHFLWVSLLLSANAVRLEPGLAFTAVIHDSVDYEFIAVTKNVGADGMRVAYHWTRPDPSAPWRKTRERCNGGDQRGRPRDRPQDHPRSHHRR